jgi:hypothetical protein
MNNFLRLAIIFFTFIFFASCSSSMTPVEVSNALPTLTKSKYLTQSLSEESVNSNKCKYLTKDRNYVAPIGFLPKDDLRNGAKGIDEWVQLDGGNAYVLKNFKWLTVDNNGSTQLHIDFDTLICE